jgi:hypothetical protein
VNTASRLCGVAKRNEVLGRRHHRLAGGPGFHVEAMPLAHVRGKERAVQTFRVMGLEEPTSTGTTANCRVRARTVPRPALSFFQPRAVSVALPLERLARELPR